MPLDVWMRSQQGNVLASGREPVTDILSLPRIATIATMPSRIETFEKVLPVIRDQVDHTFVFLDGYDQRPAFLEGLDRITVHFAEEVGNLHCSSRFLCLRHLDKPAVVCCVDDDIIYPPDYVPVLADQLHRQGGKAIVGVHGRIFAPPHQSYINDSLFLHFTQASDRPRLVHELGMGTSAFVSDRFPIDPRQWDRHDMDDIMVALEAQLRGMPRLTVPRPEGWLRPYAEAQPDSLWAKAKKDDSEQSRRMRALLALYAKIDEPGSPPKELNVQYLSAE